MVLYGKIIISNIDGKEMALLKKLSEVIKNNFSKVSTQVSLFSCILITISCIFIFLTTRTAFMKIAETLYRAKTDIIFNMIEPHLNIDELNEFTDEWSIQTESYNSIRNYLEIVKERYGVDSIFISKLNEQRKPVYVIDSKKTYEEFNIPNTLVTGGIAGDIIQTYSLRHSERGKFYRLQEGWEYTKTYQIRGSKSNVEAVACIGVNAQSLYSSTYTLAVIAALLIVACIALTWVFATKMFRKISNPIYQDVSNTDSMTGLKNKNSFSTDLHNIENLGRQERYSIIVIDLNGLKTVNDTFGHNIGDKFIRDSADILKRSTFDKNQVVYRIGGDEFVIIMHDAKHADIDRLIKTIKENTVKANEKGGSIQISMSIGYAMFDRNIDRNFSGTFQRADTMMYNVKHEYYKEKLRKQKESGDYTEDIT